MANETTNEHRKHPKLARPQLGNFNRNEWAILGTTCSKIESITQHCIRHLSPGFRCAYVDAKHQSPGTEVAELPGLLASGAALEYVDGIAYRQIQAKENWSVHQHRTFFNSCDLVLVNGNHHQATAQILVLDNDKIDSLKRRIGQLTQVELVLYSDACPQLFDFLLEALPEIQQVQMLHEADTPGLAQFFKAQMLKRRPLLNGLVLAGGKSQRMGTDKAEIAWHNKPQWAHLADLLQPRCSAVFISCQSAQQAAFESTFPTIPDSFIGLGPFGAILSAFREQPDQAWLVVACDLPLLDAPAMEHLIAARNSAKMATAYQMPGSQFPEPLITIWEPRAYPILLSFLSQGYSCPRKVLMQNDIELVEPIVPAALENVNTPEDMEKLLRVHATDLKLKR